MKFYDIHEQTKYKIKVSCPANVEDLSDLFISEDELKDLTNSSVLYFSGNTVRTYYLNSVISAEVEKLIKKLDASGRKTIPIEDEELLDVLKAGFVSDYTNSSAYGRHGNRLCYTRRYQRVKTKPTKSDMRTLWDCLQHGFKHKYGCWPSHIPGYDRHLPMLKAYMKIIGWRAVRSQLNKEDAKFIRQIWDNPEEFI